MVQALAENAAQPGALELVVQARGQGVDVDRKAPLAPQVDRDTKRDADAEVRKAVGRTNKGMD
jgi:hypothetical protein